MYAIVPSKGFVGHLLMLNGQVIAEFFCKTTADLVCNLLNVTRAAQPGRVATELGY